MSMTASPTLPSEEEFQRIHHELAVLAIDSPDQTSAEFFVRMVQAFCTKRPFFMPGENFHSCVALFPDAAFNYFMTTE